MVEARIGALPCPVDIVKHGDTYTWTNMPAALTEHPLGGMRKKVDLTKASKARLITRVTTAGAANAILKVQYSTDESAWTDLCGTPTIGTTGTKVGAWTDVPSGAKADVFIRLVGINGDGALDPVFRGVTLQVK